MFSKNDPSIKAMRTFKSDAEEAIRYQNVSSVKIAVAEQEKRDSTPIERTGESSSSRSIITVLILALLIVGFGGGYYWYFMRDTETSPSDDIIYALKAPLAYQKYAIFKPEVEQSPFEKAASLASSMQATIGDIIFIATQDSATSSAYQAAPSALFKGTRIPDRLLRTLSRDYMIGVHAFDGNSPFLILKTTFFQNAFPGMLEWEKDMRNDLLPLIRIDHFDAERIVSNSDIFTDRVIANKDVRVLAGTSGDILLYTFADKDTILIATSEKTLRNILDKLLSVRIVQ
jgi:hypothetical protein